MRSVKSISTNLSCHELVDKDRGFKKVKCLAVEVSGGLNVQFSRSSIIMSLFVSFVLSLFVLTTLNGFSRAGK